MDKSQKGSDDLRAGPAMVESVQVEGCKQEDKTRLTGITTVTQSEMGSWTGLVRSEDVHLRGPGELAQEAWPSHDVDVGESALWRCC
jgi:hypothetical protein